MLFDTCADIHRPIRSRDATRQTDQQKLYDLTAEADAVRNFRVGLMADRYRLGLDIWSGKPLVGNDADNWLRLQELETEEEG